MGILKKTLNKIPYSILLRLYYCYYALFLYSQETLFKNMFGLRSLHLSDLQCRKKSDTIFILGSGPSINSISDSRWNFISKHVTVGLNFWLIHNFVPDIYFCEVISDKIALANVCSNCLFYFMKKRSEEYKSVLKIIMDLSNANTFKWLKSLPDNWRDNLHFLYGIPVLARNKYELEYSISYLVKKKLFEKTDNFGHVFKYMGTVIAIMTMAVKMDFKRIVLCGIDLSSSKHFFDDKELYKNAPPEQIYAGRHLHGTMRSTPMLMPIDSVISVFKTQVLEPRGIELYLESCTSLLYPRIPLMPEDILNVK